MKRTPIAIIGIGCRFPGAQGPSEFWRLLRDGIDAITPFPFSRFEETGTPSRHLADEKGEGYLAGGYLDQVDQFDPSFFGISPREAPYMDPQHRLLLETAWEALEDAGQDPIHLAGTNTGVFIGLSLKDYSHIFWDRPLTEHDSASDALFLQIGTSHAMAANRLSYFLDAHGPSVTFDTACSSSLVAVHQACQSLWAGESSMALAGGASLILLPKVTERLAKAGSLSLDGRCRAFDAEGKGFVRGEGVGMVVLKPVSQAVTDGDAIYAIIQACVMNQNGRSNGITAPNLQAQEALLRDAYLQAGVSPDDVDYVEANGTGTVFGDSMEARALGTILNQGHNRKFPCFLGSVKTNIGHLEAASGIASLIKVALSLHKKHIPPSLHFNTPNPYVNFESLGLRIPRMLETWPEKHSPGHAGVNSFGFGGTNVHVVMKEFLSGPGKPSVGELPHHLFTLRARNENALRAMVKNYCDFLSSDCPGSIGDICFTANAGRTEFPFRMAIVTHSVTQLRKQCEDILSDKHAACGLWGEVGKSASPKAAFLFPGEGWEYIPVGRQLYESLPVFREAFNHCAGILNSMNDLPLPLESLFSSKSDLTQSALFALEYSLVKVWKSWGVEPEIVMGHGVGEYAAACVADVIRVEDALTLIQNENRLTKRVFQAKSADHITNMTMNADLNEAHRQFKKILASIKLNPPRIKGVCPLTGKPTSENWTDPQYWIRHAQDVVQGTGAVVPNFEEGISVGIVIGSPAKLSLSTRRISQPDRFLWCASLHPERDDLEQMLRSLGVLFIRGFKINWGGVNPDCYRKRLLLPTYPFQRQRYWMEECRSLHDPEKMQFKPDKDANKIEGNIHVSPHGIWKGNTNVPADYPRVSSKPILQNQSLNSQSRDILEEIIKTASAKKMVEELILEVWREVLKVQRIGIHDNFFELGGHSLLATQVLARLRDRLNLDIPLRTIFEQPTVGQLTQTLNSLLTGRFGSRED